MRRPLMPGPPPIYWPPCTGIPPGTVFVCVVDPGVGGDRPPMVLCAKGQVFVGPGNGLFEIIARRVVGFEARAITWRPQPCRRHFMAAIC